MNVYRLLVILRTCIYVVLQLAFFILLVPLNANATVNIDLANYRSYLTIISGNVSGVNPAVCTQCGSYQPSILVTMRYSGGSSLTIYTPSGTLNETMDYCGGNTVAHATQWANQKLLNRPRVYPDNTVSASVTYAYLENFYLTCRLSPIAGNGSGFAQFSIPVNDVVITNPPNPKSVCSLNSQNLNLNYSSTSLNVNGLTQSTSLSVSCTAGTAQNYQLRLTGTNVTNGRLNFGNGVSAQVSLNGTQVSANGSGISLNGLTSSSIPVSASLVGNATVSGVTLASGVLVLDAL